MGAPQGSVASEGPGFHLTSREGCGERRLGAEGSLSAPGDIRTSLQVATPEFVPHSVIY